MENLPMYFPRCTDIYIDKYVSFKSSAGEEEGVYFTNVEVASVGYTKSTHPGSLLSVKLVDGRVLLIQASTVKEASIAIEEYLQYTRGCI